MKKKRGKGGVQKEEKKREQRKAKRRVEEDYDSYSSDYENMEF